MTSTHPTDGPASEDDKRKASTAHRLAGRIGGLTRWSKETNRSGATAKARQSFLARFENEADPEAARKLYFARLALKRFQTRRTKKRP
jgi:hypothetical protein